MIIEQNAIGNTLYDSEKQLLTETYKGRTNIKLILDHFDKIEKFCINNDVEASIVDLRKLYGSFIKLFEIIENTYYPKMKNSGLRFQAVIISNDLIFENLYGKVSQLAEKFGIETAVFHDIDKANLWIVDKLRGVKE